MAYIAYSGLTTPNEVIEKMKDFIQTRGYNIVQPLADDLNIYDMSFSDGKRFTFVDRTGNYFINLRSANGTMIFGTKNDPQMDVTPIDSDIDYTGVGMTVSEGYTSVGRWYNQFKAPKQLNGDTIYGVFMPMKVAHVWASGILYHANDIVEYNGSQYKCINTHTSSSTFSSVNFRLLNPSDAKDTKDIESNLPNTYTLFCNNPTDPTDTIVFTLMKEGDEYHQCTHLVYSNLDKYDVWEGGALFSGSSIKQLMSTDVKVYEHTVDSDQYILPVLSSGKVSNSFLRIDIDDAPTDARGNIYWASSGTDNETGKKLSLPIRLPAISNIEDWNSSKTYQSGDVVFYIGDYYKCIATNTGRTPSNNKNYWSFTVPTLSPDGNGKIPHYFYLQSKGRRDWGRNINTLNCITIDMPIYAAVCVDPDVLDNFAAVGAVTGVWCISTLNMQTSYVYEKSYPRSGDLCQVFPHGKRRGKYGYDGISIKQADP